MGIARGPNIVKDNLVFGYDTGYGIADNNTATRFYPGEPTTNNTIQTGYTWNGDGGNQSFANKGATAITDNSLKYNGYDTVLWTPGSSLNCYLNGSSDLNLNDNSTIWTFSCYIKRDDGAAITSLSVYLYYPNGDGSASGTIVDCGDGWYRVSRTRTGTNDNIGLAGFTGFSSGHKYYLSGVMLTKNNHTVPYVNVQSSRSSTQSLIDLKRTTNIDVSNVSFDSTGQPTFDGTDDRINMGDTSFTDFGTNNFTIEAVLYIPSDITTSTNHFKGIVVKKGASSANAGMGIYYNTGHQKFLWSTANGSSGVERYTTNTFGSLLGTYIHVVMIRDNSVTNNGHFYINGVQEAITSGGSIMNVDNNFNLLVGASSTLYSLYFLEGNVPVAKIYNKALSADEIKQNFNALKNRFNI